MDQPESSKQLNKLMKTNNENKTHQHAALIKAWADGAKIQWFDNYDSKWKDTVDNTPMWDDKIQYRVKPEEPSNEPWKPQCGVEYWFIGVDFTPENDIWRDDYFDKRNFKYGNCFQTKEEAEAAIPRVKDALKNTTDVSDNVGSNVGSPELDGKPLTDGEVALIKALREYPLTQIHGADGKSILIHTGTSGYMQTKTSHISIWSDTSSVSCDENVKAALKQIKEEQEASNEAD